jgi:hypothetical protein
MLSNNYFQIVQLQPLAVRYFELGPAGLCRSSEYAQEVLEEDAARVVAEPVTIARGSRVYYKFDL